MMPTLQETLRAVDDLFLQRSAEAERREPLPLRPQGPQGPQGPRVPMVSWGTWKPWKIHPFFIGKPR